MNLLLRTGDQVGFTYKDGEIKIGYVQLGKRAREAGIHLIEDGKLVIYAVSDVKILTRY